MPRGVDSAWLVWLSAAAAGLAASCASLSGLTNGDDGGLDGDDRDAMRAMDGRGADGPVSVGPDACLVAGKMYESGAVNPANACQGCRPSVAVTTWSSLSDGTPCGVDGVCYLGGCVSGCEIGGVYYAINAPNPNDPCQGCQPGKSTTSWNPIADGTTCGNGQICTAGQCGTQCEISGTVYPTGAADPANPCQQCQPGSSTTMWTSAASGTSCGGGQVCNAGTCVPGCFFGGALYAPSSANPNNVCQTCQPAVTTSSWSPIEDGTACGNGQICGGGRCGTQCDVNGIVYASGATNPTNSCQACEPGATTSAWTNAASGTSCAAAEVCSGGACTSGCYIQATLFSSTNPNPMNPCQTCQPASSTSAWTNAATGSPCGTGQVCNTGTCALGCYIGAVVYASGNANPGAVCQSCQPLKSTTGWSADADGTTCGGSKVCSGGLCVPGSGSGSGTGSGSGVQ